MRVGLVCPYSLDVPGGVQNHVRDLAEILLARGHHASVLAPSERADLPDYVVPVGGAVAVPYNGSVARVSFGPVVASRVRRWLRDGAFDVLHVHEPATPSVSLLALWSAECPVVATFHTSQVRSRALAASASLLRPAMERITARIAVSELARDTLVQHTGGEPVVIPNGVTVEAFASARARLEWAGPDGTVVFVGRLDEPRKGFALLAEAFSALAGSRPGLRLLVVGGGDVAASRALLAPAAREQARFLGPASDEDRAAALATADVYVAPNTGGESFGIVLVEAMAAGAAVLASDLPAFARVLDGGRSGLLVGSGDASALAGGLARLLEDTALREALVARGRHRARQYDWSVVATRIVQVYETVARGAAR